jgi:hypothetical protein
MKHAKECLDHFLDAKAPGVVAIKGDWGAGKTKEAIARRRNAILKAKHPRDIIYSMVENEGWNPEDTEALDLNDVDYFVNWFKEERDEKLLSMLAQFVKRFNPRTQDPEMRQIGEKVYSAFRQIAHGNNFIRTKLTEIVGVSIEDLQEDLDKSGNETEVQSIEADPKANK